MVVTKIYDSERPNEGWVKVGGPVLALIENRLEDYSNLDCDNCWESYIAVAVDDEAADVYLGSYGSWLHSTYAGDERPSFYIDKVGPSDLKGYGLEMTKLNPRKDYIL